MGNLLTGNLPVGKSDQLQQLEVTPGQGCGGCTEAIRHRKFRCIRSVIAEDQRKEDERMEVRLFISSQGEARLLWEKFSREDSKAFLRLLLFFKTRENVFMWWKKMRESPHAKHFESFFDPGRRGAV